MISWLIIGLLGWGLYVSICFLKGYLVFYVVMKRQKKVMIKYSLNISFLRDNSIVQIATILARSIDSIFKILLPNWLVSDFFKKCIEISFQDIGDEQGSRNKRREFIKTMNYLNLLISVICIVLFALLRFIENYRCGFWLSLVLFLLCLRAISRSYEIIKAFLNDVLQPSNNKFSSLKYYERLGLALTSLFEVGINYSFIYYICLGNLGLALEKSVGNTLLVNVNEINIVTVLQVLTSMTLIYLALANYIGSKDEGELE